ncbi:MAG: radical SAM protein [Candidatus Omnitrophota bacterium]
MPDALSYGADGGNVNLKHLGTFLEEIKNEGMNIHFGIFPSEVSPGSLARCPDAALTLKKYITNRKIVIGGQSASGRVLKIMNRDHTHQDILSSIKILRETGFTPVVDILFGVPGENAEDRLETVKFMEYTSVKFRAGFNIHYFLPLPGTPLYGKQSEPVEPAVKEKIYALMKNGHARGDFFKQLGYS